MEVVPKVMAECCLKYCRGSWWEGTAGLLHNPAYRDDTDDEDDEECSTTVAKYRPHVLRMAAELVQALLQQLVCHKLYTQQELDPGIAAATCGVQELPICAVSPSPQAL